MANLPKPKSGDLQAVLQEVEPGLFQALYPGEANQENAGIEALPDSHIGTDAAGVKNWVEQMASGLGYDRVEWVQPEKT